MKKLNFKKYKKNLKPPKNGIKKTDQITRN